MMKKKLSLLLLCVLLCGQHMPLKAVGEDFGLEGEGTEESPITVKGSAQESGLKQLSLDQKLADCVKYIEYTVEPSVFKQLPADFTLDFLKNFQNLTGLNIALHKVQCLDFLASCQKLEKLKLSHYQGSFKSLDQSLTLPNLTDLEFEKCDGIADLSFLECFLGSASGLTSLVLSRCDNLEKLCGVEKLTFLKSLRISGMRRSLTDISSLRSCTSLICLELPQVKGGLDVLGSLHLLKSIALKGDEALESLRQCKGSIQPDTLKLLVCPKLQDMDFLKDFPTVKVLTVSSTNLISVCGVEHCSDLKALSLPLCNKLGLDGLKALQECQALETLVLPEEVHGGYRAIKDRFFPNVSFNDHNGGFTVENEQIRFLQEQLKELSNETAAESSSSTWPL